MNILKGVDRFELNNDFVLNQEIESMFANLVITIEKWNWLLSNECNSLKREFNGERLLVN